MVATETQPKITQEQADAHTMALLEVAAKALGAGWTAKPAESAWLGARVQHESGAWIAPRGHVQTSRYGIGTILKLVAPHTWTLDMRSLHVYAARREIEYPAIGSAQANWKKINETVAKRVAVRAAEREEGARKQAARLTTEAKAKAVGDAVRAVLTERGHKPSEYGATTVYLAGIPASVGASQYGALVQITVTPEKLSEVLDAIKAVL